MDAQKKSRFNLLQSVKWTVKLLPLARATPGFSLIDVIHGYVYSHFPYWYIGVATGNRAPKGFLKPMVNFLFNFMVRFPADSPRFDEQGIHPQNGGRRFARRSATFADTYHGKVVRADAAKKLISINQNIRLENLEEVIPYSTARDLILESPDHILAFDCPCRAVRPNPCTPMDVCLIVGEPFASFGAEYHRARSRWIDRKEAMDILAAEAERGHVHHAFFKEAMLGRFFAICNCCGCCCGAIQAQRNGIHMLASSGYLGTVDPDVCTGCGTCKDLCQFTAISITGKRAVVDPATCLGCGVCESHCPRYAIRLQRDPTRSAPLDLDKLIPAQSGKKRIISVL